MNNYQAVFLFAVTFGCGFVIGYGFCIRSLNDTLRFIASIRILPDSPEAKAAAQAEPTAQPSGAEESNG